MNGYRGYKGLVTYVAGPLIFAYFYVLRLNSHHCGGRNRPEILIDCKCSFKEGVSEEGCNDAEHHYCMHPDDRSRPYFGRV